MVEKIRDFCERRGYEVCSRMGERIGISSDVVRRYFIYVSFLTFGSPVLLYFFLAFWISIKDHFRTRRRSVLDI